LTTIVVPKIIRQAARAARSRVRELSMTLRKYAVLAIACGLVAIPSAAVAGKVVVVRSAGAAAKAYPPGKALPDSSSIKLESGDMVTLLGPSSARTLRGPGVFVASAADRSSVATAAGRRSRFGALRTGQVAKNPSLWDLDVTRSGTMCVADTGKLKLWRPEADAAAKLNIRGAGKQQSIDFAPGEVAVAWPSGLPVSDGTEYQIEVEGGEDPAKLSFVTVKSPPSDLIGAAELLIAKGCQNQLELLVESAAKAE
jgi:hypothetical protein